MVRAAAKEPTIVALAKAFLEFIGVILSREQRAFTGRRNTGLTIGMPENPATAGLKANPDADVTSVVLVDYFYPLTIP
jgi:hypothetical protein